MSTEDKARKIAAKIAGLREDQVDAAVTAYRDALDSLYDEPEWKAVVFILGCCTCWAEGTDVEMHFASKTKTKPAERLYVYKRVVYKTYGEARAAELEHRAKFSVRAVT